MAESPLLASYFSGALGQSMPSEASIVQSLKDCGTGFLELQINVVHSTRYRHAPYTDSSYKIRRRDWESLKEKSEFVNGIKRSIWERSQDDWNQNTVYVVSLIPSQIIHLKPISQSHPLDRCIYRKTYHVNTGHFHQHYLLPVHSPEGAWLAMEGYRQH
jgi:hypothetical protein